MPAPLLLEAAAFHLAERWYQRESPSDSPAAAERWAARHRARFRSVAVDVLNDLAALRIMRNRLGIATARDRRGRASG